jgi:pilus assembly protein CpaD
MKSRLPFLIFGLSALGACASVPTPDVSGPAVASAADRHRPVVLPSVERIDIAVSPDETTLSSEERARLRAFASGYLRYGHGALVLETPSGGANSDAASVVAADARRALVDYGVSYAAITGSTRAADGDDAPIILSFARFEAKGPDCAPLWEQDLAHQSNNQPWESFGCATQSNIAALVEDPADLERPRDEAPRDSGRRTTVMDAYREGEPTHAERSNDERVSISDAVQ